MSVYTVGPARSTWTRSGRRKGETNRGIREVEVELRMLVLCYLMCDASVGHDRRR